MTKRVNVSISHIDATARNMIRSLRAARDPAKAQGVQRYFKEAVVSVGMDIPTLRGLVHDQLKSLKSRWTATEAVRYCDRLLREPELEIRGAGILLLSGFHQQLDADFEERAGRWLEERMDNWALVDSFCGCVLSPLLHHHPKLEQTLRLWSRAKIIWVRRASLVTLVPFARKGLLLDVSYELAREHFSDPEDLMHKATGWLLREAGKTDANRLRIFLLEHGTAIPRTTLRYAIERFPAPERRTLLERTREKDATPENTIKRKPAQQNS